MMDITGNVYHRWTVLSLAKPRGAKTFYLCACACGTRSEVRKDQLTRSVSKSCGCWKAEVASEQIRRLSTTHGQSHKTRTYEIWKGIRKRCLNQKDHAYPHYGGRGISICDRWANYEHFLADMGEAPRGHSIERINVNGNYEPSNCRWATTIEQMNNMRTNVFIKFRGETHTLKQWSRILDIPYHTIYQRIFKLSWPVKQAFTTPKLVNQFSER